VASALLDRGSLYAAAPRLTERERQVLQLIAEGLTSMQIGDRLHIAASTVDVHRRNLMRKLDLHNVAKLTRYAITQGISPTRQALDGGLPN
jgi:two-component system NarL family response regulator